MNVQLDGRADGESAAILPDPGPAFSWRATRVLAVFGLVSLAAGLVIAVAGDRSIGQLVTAAAASVGSLGSLGLAMALRDRRTWAVPWARLALVMIAAIGLGHTLIGLPNGAIWLPVDTLLAVWALLAGDGTPPGRVRPHAAGLVLVALIVLTEGAGLLGAAAAERSMPSPDPNAVIVVENGSPRAVAVLAGSPFGGGTDARSAAPCGGVVRIQIRPTDYETDGRLMAMIAIDTSGQLDAWTATTPGASESFNGSASLSPIWSRGDLAGKLPLRLVVHSDFTVDTSPSSSSGCTPNPSAAPAPG